MISPPCIEWENISNAQVADGVRGHGNRLPVSLLASRHTQWPILHTKLPDFSPPGRASSCDLAQSPVAPKRDFRDFCSSFKESL